jgi:hypothetical protein
MRHNANRGVLDLAISTAFHKAPAASGPGSSTSAARVFSLPFHLNFEKILQLSNIHSCNPQQIDLAE